MQSGVERVIAMKPTDVSNLFRQCHHWGRVVRATVGCDKPDTFLRRNIPLRGCIFLYKYTVLIVRNSYFQTKKNFLIALFVAYPYIEGASYCLTRTPSY